MKKEVTPKLKGLKTKTSDEKRGNPMMQRAHNKDLRRKKGNPKTHKGIKIKGDFTNGKPGTISSPKPALLN
jgi:hypothetical protein